MKTAVAPARTALQISNILFATDFSPAAIAALPFAAQLAREFGAKLYAVHAKAPENYALPATEIWPIANAQLEKETTDFKQTLDADFPDINRELVIMEGGVTGVRAADSGIGATILEGFRKNSARDSRAGAARRVNDERLSQLDRALSERACRVQAILPVSRRQEAIRRRREANRGLSQSFRGG